MGFPGLVIIIERLIFGSADSTDHVPIPHRDKEVSFGMLEKWMLLSVEGQICIHIQRRYPLRTILVQLVRKINESLDLTFVVCIDFFDGKHEKTPAMWLTSAEVYNTND